MFDSERHHRRSIRLPHYDYAWAGWYAVTLCIHERACLLSTIVAGDVELTTIGCVVEEEWLRTPQLRPQMRLDAYVLMPNHIHAIVVITERDMANPVPNVGAIQTPSATVGAYCNTPLREHATIPRPGFESPSQTLGAVIRGFKAAATRRVNLLRHTPGLRLWQRNYYEHIIRDDADLARIRDYIGANPACWVDDPEHTPD